MSLCLTENHAMKMDEGAEVQPHAVLTSALDAVSFTARPLYPRGKGPGTTGCWVGPIVGLDAVGKRIISCPSWHLNHFLVRPSRVWPDHYINWAIPVTTYATLVFNFNLGALNEPHIVLNLPKRNLDKTEICLYRYPWSREFSLKCKIPLINGNCPKRKLKWQIKIM
jgi:hypothetical protein